MKKLLFVFSILIFCVFSMVSSKDLIVSVGNIPGVADSPEKGTLIDLLKAMDNVYTEGKFIINVYPYPRSMNNVIQGKADFHAPGLRSPYVPVDKMPFKYSTDKIGSVAFVIYSHKEKPITKKMLESAIAKGGKFPYKIEGATQEAFNFPVQTTTGSEQSLLKLDAKRIDAIIMGQEDIDIFIRLKKLKNVHREFFAYYDDIMYLPKGSAGDSVDKIITVCINRMKKSGKLQKLYSKIHAPYQDWQPSEMGW